MAAMAPKVALVTGTNSGIGLAASVQLCQAGFTTFATVRSISKADSLKAAAAAVGVSDLLHVIEMDVTSDASVTGAVQSLLAETNGRVDVVVANAGYGDMSPPEVDTVRRLHENLDVNLYGVVRLCNAVLPAMRAGGRGGRVIVTSSVVGLLAFPLTPVYCTTKFAVEGYVESMAATYAPIGIHFSLVEPGPVGTDFSTNATGGEGEGAPPAELAGVATAFRAAFGQMLSAPQSSDDCAAFIVKAATDAPAPQLRYMTYEGLAKMVQAKYVDLTGTTTMEVLRGMTTEQPSA